jgi:exodeoxyribonuclease-3
LKLATWNVNSLNVRLPHLLDWLGGQLKSQAEPPFDIIGLQELKLSDDKFPHAELNAAGYEATVFGQKTYNGVALLHRRDALAAPVDVVRNIPGFTDEQSRVVAGSFATAAGALRVVNAYFVNGQAPGTEKFDYKMSWLRALRDWLREELANHPRLVLMGDFNITFDDLDTHDPVGLKDSIHHTDAERAHLRHLMSLGLHDAFRLFEQPPRSFTWWDYRMLAYQKGQGLRIDYTLVSDALKPAVTACAVDRAPRKLPKPSDHAPVVLSLNLGASPA